LKQYGIGIESLPICAPVRKYSHHVPVSRLDFPRAEGIPRRRTKLGDEAVTARLDAPEFGQLIVFAFDRSS
jgi:hypothetical protein